MTEPIILTENMVIDVLKNNRFHADLLTTTYSPNTKQYINNKPTFRLTIDVEMTNKMIDELYSKWQAEFEKSLSENPL